MSSVQNPKRSNDKEKLVSTELVSIHGSKAGVNLPTFFQYHCMVQYAPNLILIIGGTQNKTLTSKDTWIIDIENDFDVIKGPTLRFKRKYHACGKFNDEYGHTIVIVAGGYNEFMVEFLNTTLMNEWKIGRYLHGNDFTIMRRIFLICYS